MKTNPLPIAECRMPMGGATPRPLLPTLLFAFIFHTSSFLLSAFPPAPHHLLFGMVRNEHGHPISTAGAELILEPGDGVQIKTRLYANLDPGVNYQLAIPMDSSVTSALYQPNAMRPLAPFKLKVRIGSTIYLPIEMVADYARLGQPGGTTRLNLTLGEDSDGDGIPDAWERALIAALGGGKTLADIKPGDDSDGDGLNNLQEYLAGTYAYDPKEGFTLSIVRFNGSAPVLEFLAIRGRTYSVLGSDDLKTWTPVNFRLPAEGVGAAAQGNYAASDVRPVQFEPTPSAEGAYPRFFRLKVQ